MLNLNYLNYALAQTNGNEFKVLYLICNTLGLNQKNRIQIYNDLLEDKCNLSERQIIRITNALVDKNLIKKDIVSDGKVKKIFYSITDKNVSFNNIFNTDKNVPFTEVLNDVENEINFNQKCQQKTQISTKNVSFNNINNMNKINNKEIYKESADDVVDVQAGINSICGANVNANLGQICTKQEGTTNDGIFALKSNSEEGDKQENRNITSTSEGINRNITPTSGITDNTPTAEGLNINPDGLCNSNPIEVQPTINPNSQQTAHNLPHPPQIPLTPPSPYIESLGLPAEDYKPFDGCLRDVAISGTAQQLQTAIISMAQWFEGVERKYQIPHNVLEEVFSQIMEDERRINGRVWAAYSDII